MRLGLASAAWLAGLIFGLSLDIAPGDIAPGAVLLLAAGGVALAISMRLSNLPALPAILATVMLLGMAHGMGSQGGLPVTAGLYGQEATATGQIVDDPETRGTRTRFELQISTIERNGETLEVDERWLVYAAAPDELVHRRSAPYFRYGDDVVVRGTPDRPQPFNGFDYPAYLAARGVSTTMFADDARVVGEGGSWWRRAIYSFRGQMSDSVERAIPHPESALGQALLLGKRESMPPDLADRFRGTGAAHLLAISGLHVGILLAVSSGTAAWLLGRRRHTYLVVAAAVIWAYVLTAGAPPSATRAAVMGTVYLVALAAGRPSSILPALALAAAVMTAISPNLVGQVSFQLSFAAMAGISLSMTLFAGGFGGSASPSAGWQRRLLGGVVGLAAVSAAATLATWPLVALYFDEVALLGVPVSLLVIPAMAPAVITTAAAGVAGLVFEPFGQLLGWIAVAPTAYLLAIVSTIPAWTVQADWVDRPFLLGWYGGLGLALLAAQPHRTRRLRRSVGNGVTRLKSTFRRDHSVGADDRIPDGQRWRFPSVYASLTFAAALGIAAAILWSRAWGGPDGLLHVHFLDIGQGDSILVVTPSGRRALIDGGPDGDIVAQRLSETIPRGSRSLDLVVMTHLDSDHSHGLLEVLDRFDVGTVLSGPAPGLTVMTAEWEQRLQRRGLAAVEITSGHVIDLGDGVEARVLNPRQGPPSGNLNNDSVVLRVTYGETSFLLTADIEQEAEEGLTRGGDTLASTVLKAGHHGSNTSSSADFLEAVGPSLAVISAGAGNQYGHPTNEVLERLEAYVGAANVFRTDLDGDVEVISDGESVWVATRR